LAEKDHPRVQILAHGGLDHFEPADFATEELLFDPQTSGGLLYSMTEAAWESIRTKTAGLPFEPAVIGRVIPRSQDPQREIVVR
ncbi:MAG: hypothetical protein QMB61_02660, partial [Clostridiaceae bacterium]